MFLSALCPFCRAWKKLNAPCCISSLFLFHFCWIFWGFFVFFSLIATLGRIPNCRTRRRKNNMLLAWWEKLSQVHKESVILGFAWVKGLQFLSVLGSLRCWWTFHCDSHWNTTVSMPSAWGHWGWTGSWFLAIQGNSHLLLWAEWLFFHVFRAC